MKIPDYIFLGILFVLILFWSVLFMVAIAHADIPGGLSVQTPEDQTIVMWHFVAVSQQAGAGGAIFAEKDACDEVQLGVKADLMSLWVSDCAPITLKKVDHGKVTP